MIFNLRLIYVESKSYVPPEEAIKHRQGAINFNFNIKNTIVISGDTPFGQQSALRVDFGVTITYISPSLGYMRFEGTADYFNQKKNIDELKEKWNGDEVVDVKTEIANKVIATISPIALILARSLELPSPFQIPLLQFQKQGITEGKKKLEFTNYHG